MSKVKKRAVVTGAKVAKPRRKTKATSVKRSGSKKAAVKRSAQPRLQGKPRKPEIARAAPEVKVAIKELDPLLKCGQGTSVQFLYRIDEKVEGRTTHHLVFFDHHGWYCEHGRECPAVIRAKKYNGQLARAS